MWKLNRTLIQSFQQPSERFDGIRDCVEMIGFVLFELSILSFFIRYPSSCPSETAPRKENVI